MTFPYDLLERAIGLMESAADPSAEVDNWLREARSWLAPPTAEHQRLIDRARELYGSTELEIDDDAALSDGDDDGTWVAAWVWLTDPTCAECQNPPTDCECGQFESKQVPGGGP